MQLLASNSTFYYFQRRHLLGILGFNGVHAARLAEEGFNIEHEVAAMGMHVERLLKKNLKLVISTIVPVRNENIHNQSYKTWAIIGLKLVILIKFCQS